MNRNIKMCKGCLLENNCALIEMFYSNDALNEEAKSTIMYVYFIDPDWEYCKLRESLDEELKDRDKPKLRYKFKIKPLLVNEKQLEAITNMNWIHDMDELLDYYNKHKTSGIFAKYSDVEAYFYKEKVKHIARIKQEIKNLKYKQNEK